MEVHFVDLKLSVNDCLRSCPCNSAFLKHTAVLFCHHCHLGSNSQRKRSLNKQFSMEDRKFTGVYENIENSENPNFEEREQAYDQINEDFVFPSSRQDVLDNNFVRCQESPENSCADSLSFQHEYDAGMDSSHQDVPEAQQPKEMLLVSPGQGDGSEEQMTFESKVLSLNDFNLKNQSTFQTFPITIKFPSNSNLEENNNFPKEDFDIFLVIKVRTVAR